MQKIFFCLFCVLTAALCGCSTTKQIAKNLQQKSLIGDGVLTINQITVTSPETGTYTPELKSIFVSGKFLSLLKDATFFSYDHKSSASTFNASAITTTESLIIQTKDPEELAKVLKQITTLKSAASPQNKK